MNPAYFFRVLFLILCGTLISYSQQVRWEPSGGNLEEGKTQVLRMIFDQCSPETKVDLPEVDGIRFGRPSESRQVQMINFSVSQKFILAYPVEVTRQGKIVIPAFEVLTNKGPKQVAEVTFNGVEATVGGGGTPSHPAVTSGKPSNDIVKSFLKLQPDIVWAGQVVDVVYELFVANRYGGKEVGPIDWKPKGLTLEPWNEMQPIENVFNGVAYGGGRWQTRGLVDESAVGSTFAPLLQRLSIQTGTGGFFSFPQVEDLNVKSALSDVQVKPLPPAPSDFLGGVGQFKLKSTVVPKQVNVGEPITWTVTLEGTGNWPAGLSLPEREVSKDFRVIQPKANQANVKNKLFDATLTEDVVLIPEKEGDYTLSPVHYTYFDPTSGTYKTIQTEPTALVIKPSTLASQFRSQDFSPLPQRSSSRQTEMNSAPLLPRDPVSGWGLSFRPLSYEWWIFFGGSILGVLGLWLKHAWSRVPLTERYRNQRLSKIMIKEAIDKVGIDEVEGLRDWRSAVISFLEIQEVVPTSIEISDSIKNWGGLSEEWKDLWEKAEERLFSGSDQLDSLWTTQAKAALQSLRIPKVNRWELLKPRNLFPLVVLFFLWSSCESFAGSFEELYRDGKFDEAKSISEGRLKEKPDNWISRSHLSLCLIQKNQWNEAYAQALSAWLLHPRNEDLLWNLELASQQTHLSPLEILKVPLSPWNPLYQLSVFEWQMLGVIGIILTLLGSLFYLNHLYSQKPWKPWNRVLWGLGVCLITCSLVAWISYGAFADSHAMILVKEAEIRSIPTDLQEGVQSKKIPMGTVLILKKEFLGWAKVRLAQQEEGWIRKSNLVPLYRKFEE